MRKQTDTSYHLEKGEPYPPGAAAQNGGINLCVDAGETKASGEEGKAAVLLYHREETQPFCRLDFAPGHRIGNLYFARLSPRPPKNCTYTFLLDGEEVCDPYAKSICGREVFGEEPGMLRGRFAVDGYDWEEDCAPQIPYEDAIMYTGHVRNLTMDPSARVKKKGTFAGIVERIPYLQALGINVLELQPVYEFAEVGKYGRMNCWGYGPGFYFAPKASYAWGKDAGKELKDCVKALHRAGIELILEMYFPAHTYVGLMVECLKYWLLEYHVDGFHLSGFGIPMEILAKEPLLAGVKLLGNGFPTKELYPDGQMPGARRLAEVHDGPQTDYRRFLRGEAGMAGSFAARLRSNPADRAVVNYVASHNGFTLADLVSYEEKHNEANQEGNRDGSDYNCSCNYGEEGTSRKKKIREIRSRQMRNALLMVFLSQGVPCIHAGDECGNSQQGNNNAYCLDNPVAWVQYAHSREGQALLQFTARLIAFRKRHPVFHRKQELTGMDLLACGCPDISFHGRNVWYPEFEGSSRQLGVLYAGPYVKDSYFYVAYNMYAEEKPFALPALPDGMRWRRVIDTSLPETEIFPDSEELQTVKEQKEMMVKGRSIVVLEGCLPGGTNDKI